MVQLELVNRHYAKLKGRSLFNFRASWEFKDIRFMFPFNAEIPLGHF